MGLGLGFENDQVVKTRERGPENDDFSSLKKSAYARVMGQERELKKEWPQSWARS